MHHNGHSFLIAYALWVLFGAVLVGRAFFIILKKFRTMDTGNIAARKREVQKQFQIVGLIWIATLPILLGVYYLVVI